MVIGVPLEGVECHDPGTLTLTAQACRDAGRLTMTYTAGDGAETSRTVEPHRLVSLGRRWYVVAYDLDRQDWRSFRLDRIEELRATTVRFRPRELPAEDMGEYVRRAVRAAPALPAVSAVIHAPVAQVEARLGRWASVDRIDDGSCHMRMTTDSLDWAALALGAADAEITQVSPPELLVLVHGWADRLGRARWPPVGRRLECQAC